MPQRHLHPLELPEDLTLRFPNQLLGTFPAPFLGTIFSQTPCLLCPGVSLSDQTFPIGFIYCYFPIFNTLLC